MNQIPNIIKFEGEEVVMLPGSYHVGSQAIGAHMPPSEYYIELE
jgi:hypothetical protein